MRWLVAVIVSIVMPSPALAQDIWGGTDHPLVGRYEGSRLVGYEQRAFDELTFLVRQPSAGNDASKRWTPQNSMTAQGRVTRLAYLGPDGRSPLEVYTNYRSQIASRGFQPVFECVSSTCDPGGSEFQFYNTQMARVRASDALFNGVVTAFRGVRYGAFRRGQDWITLYVATNADQRLVAWVQVVEAAALEGGKIVVPTAQQIAGTLRSDGRQALYGILFDFNQAAVKPESKPTLDQVAAVLRANPQLRLIVAGHTDSVGEFQANVQLSQRRAAAVIDRLVKDYGIAPARLTAFGAGMAAPIAANTTEDGRAKNRRVELVQR
jgi:outer membrane protein OmpA-like peptidoglycan-associated protein